MLYFLLDLTLVFRFRIRLKIPPLDQFRLFPYYIAPHRILQAGLNGNDDSIFLDGLVSCVGVRLSYVS